MIHERRVYNILQLFSDLGGVSKTLFFVFILFQGPISEYSFRTLFIENLYQTQVNQMSRRRKRNVKVQKKYKN